MILLLHNINNFQKIFILTSKICLFYIEPCECHRVVKHAFRKLSNPSLKFISQSNYICVTI